MRPYVLLLVVAVACAHRPRSSSSTVANAPTSSAAGATPDGGAAPSPGIGGPSPACPVGGPCPPGQAQLEPEAANEEDDEPDEAEEPIAEEEESREPAGGVSDEVRYTKNLSEKELKERWTKDPGSLGCISVGFADEGRLINAQQMAEGDGWTVVSPSRAWATQETLEYLVAALQEVRRMHPNSPRLRVNQMSSKDGGYLPPHKSHQSGRDVDLAFYYRVSPPARTRDRYKFIDPELNWELVKALVTQGDVQMVLVDRKVQKVLYDYALKRGEDKAWLDALFHGGPKGLIRHARRHRDHFHVRYYNPRAQELGRRVAPLLALRPEQNIAMHRVRQGNTLGALARKYGTTVAAIQKANHLRKTFLRLGQLLKIPLRGPCTHCPIPPPLVVPERLLPPSAQAAISASPAGAEAPSGGSLAPAAR